MQSSEHARQLCCGHRHSGSDISYTDLEHITRKPFLTREASGHRAFYAHPGEVAAAEAEAIAAQRAALRALPAAAAARVEVVASVCTDVPSFLHSQPTLTALAGAPASAPSTELKE